MGKLKENLIKDFEKRLVILEKDTKLTKETLDKIKKVEKDSEAVKIALKMAIECIKKSERED